MKTEFHPFDRREQLQGLQTAMGENLMTVVPLLLIQLHDRVIPRLLRILRPAVRGDVHGVEVITVVLDKLAPREAEGRRGLVSKANDVPEDGEDAMSLEESTGLMIIARGR